MELELIDWLFIAGFFVLSLVIGLAVSRKSGASSTEYFLSGRNMPWWLLGISMVATTFSADTPNLVANIVRSTGVFGNWVWWASLLTGMLTVFVYAKLWRRSGVVTDVEFYEMRYSGRPAAFLRGFRALYLGVFFNVMIMANVSLAAIKIGSVMLGLAPWETLLIASTVTVIYSSLGGLRGVMITDFVQFFIAIVGSFAAAYYLLDLPQVGGLDGLLSHPSLEGKLSVLPDFAQTEWTDLLPMFVVPLLVQWWAAWYPGAEPGGGGYVVQRVLSAKNEKHAMGATLLFNAAHYALRPWPWILVGLASMIVFPNLDSIQAAFPNVEAHLIGDDLAYPAMLTYLPSGLLGLVVASLIAAFMSTISTQLNWGSSYIVNDFYKRFIKPEASEKELVMVGRLTTVGLMVLSALMALALEDALGAFQILMQIGAGTGLIYLLRWFWWRINAMTEIVGMVASFVMALLLEIVLPQWFGVKFEAHVSMLIGVGVTTACWLAATFMTEPTDEVTLRNFVRIIQPGGNGWNPIDQAAEADGEILRPDRKQGQLNLEILCMVIGTLTIYSALFAAGFWIYGDYTFGGILTVVAAIGTFVLFKVWGRLQARDENEVKETA
ncbi:sodium:solute symporter family protein [Pontibacter sp. G13]|uniref:sodium:solute symporter family protein n=1 Tax=Pontibacter sp. G13 TaxID=3074898 RepID=UPI00288A6ED4|nr:sodium:solute symporter family protein [Pontibacter sp. G13]WNJ21026.1 sodium:solute symporter family protein [Pontibacter sp. G13]